MPENNETSERSVDFYFNNIDFSTGFYIFGTQMTRIEWICADFFKNIISENPPYPRHPRSINLLNNREFLCPDIYGSFFRKAGFGVFESELISG